MRAERLDPVERRGDVLEEDEGVVVALVDGHPRERARIAGGPLREQRRLAVTGGGDDEHDREGAGGAQAVDERRPRDTFRLSHRRAELRLDDVAEDGGIAGSDEDRLGAELPQRRVQGTATDAETAVPAYGLDVNFAIPFPASAVDEGCDTLHSEYPGEKARGHWRIR